MCYEPSTHEQFMNTFDTTEESCMEQTNKQELIKQLKEAKERREFTYPRIMECMEKNGKFLSLTTLRRVFADGSEMNANSFNYDTTLLPIAEVLLDAEDVPTPEDSPYAAEINGLKSVIHVQNEEIVRLHELKEHLEARVTFLLEQIEKKDRRMDEKDELIKRLMDKCLLFLKLFANPQTLNRVNIGVFSKISNFFNAFACMKASAIPSVSYL